MTERTKHHILGVLFAVAGLAVAFVPRVLASRFLQPAGSTGAHFALESTALASSVGIALAAFGVRTALGAGRSERFRQWVNIAFAIVAYLALVSCLALWMIDDAGITFAYSENLVRGYGLRLHPSLPPEEAYSNTSWMLWLAALRVAGFSVPLAAKVSCVTLGVATCWLLHAALRRVCTTLGDASWLLATVILLGAPYLVWSVSGLEHGLQALCIFLAATLPLFSRRYSLWTGVSLAVLTLTRPEAPLLVVACFSVHVWDSRADRGFVPAVRRHLWVALLPLLTWIALIAFRLSYFGDPLPNPYYAKASQATFVSLLNLVGGGWAYVLSWAFGSAFIMTLPRVARAFARPVPRAITLAATLAFAQIIFVVYAHGDWMGCWRFVAPILPILALIVGWAYQPLPGDTESNRTLRARSVALCLTLTLLCIGTMKQYLEFLVDPTTPFAEVSKVGARFAELGSRLGLKEPILAHHDAGGTSFSARIRLLDLGGLGDRTLAKHWNDPVFVAKYILDEVRPDFIYGETRVFAAVRSGFYLRPEFTERYVPLEFPEEAHMTDPLCHIKRSLIESREPPPGVEVIRQSGTIIRVIVH